MQEQNQSGARPKNAAATREAILAAARQRFLGESYDSVGLRDIAGDAGVDVALIGRYFGGKEKLFGEVLETCDGPLLPDAMPPEDLPSFLTEVFMAQDAAGNRQHAERLLIVLRSSSSPVAAEIVRNTLRHDIMQPIADHLCGAMPEARASLAMAVWMGATIMRTIMAVEPMCDEKCAVISAKLDLLYEAALSELDARPVGTARLAFSA